MNTEFEETFTNASLEVTAQLGMISADARIRMELLDGDTMVTLFEATFENTEIDLKNLSELIEEAVCFWMKTRRIITTEYLLTTAPAAGSGLSEVGVSYDIPADVGSVSWLREGLYSYLSRGPYLQERRHCFEGSGGSGGKSGSVWCGVAVALERRYEKLFRTFQRRSK